jgi:hypothetical protein
MTNKNGRPRQFNFREEGFPDSGSQWMFGMLLELGDRVLDQVEHVPAAVLNAAPEGSYLAPARVVLHLVGTDLRMLPLLVGPFDAPDYQADVQKTTSEDFPTMKTAHLDTVGILRRHLAWRSRLIKERGTQPGLLDLAVEHPACATKRDLLGHQIWHWSFHSGHIGAVTLEQGYEYIWTSAPKG